MPHQRGTDRPTLSVLDVAREHYLEGRTMEAISKDLGVSRSTVSRMLKHARESGLVRITLADPVRTNDHIAAQLDNLFNVRARVVAVPRSTGELARLEHVSRASAQLISELMVDGLRVGCAWGTTLASVVRFLEPRRYKDVKVVQINGGANPRTSGIPFVGQMISQFASAFDGEAVLFPVPTFFDQASTREAMWRERSIKPILTEQRDVDLAVFGVGSLTGPVPSHVYVSGYLDDEDFASLATDEVAGDVCTVFTRRDGSWADITLNARSTGLNPAELAAIERRLCIVAGRAKAPALLGALRAGVATDLVVDEALAQAVIALTNEEGGRH